MLKTHKQLMGKKTNIYKLVDEDTIWQLTLEALIERRKY